MRVFFAGQRLYSCIPGAKPFNYGALAVFDVLSIQRLRKSGTGMCLSDQAHLGYQILVCDVPPIVAQLKLHNISGRSLNLAAGSVAYLI